MCASPHPTPVSGDPHGLAPQSAFEVHSCRPRGEEADGRERGFGRGGPDPGPRGPSQAHTALLFFLYLLFLFFL